MAAPTLACNYGARLLVKSSSLNGMAAFPILTPVRTLKKPESFRWTHPETVKNLKRWDRYANRWPEALEHSMTEENRQLATEYAMAANLMRPSPLKNEPWPLEEWRPRSIRSGVLAIKLGTVPHWTSDGQRLVCTALQVLECNVIKYESAEENKRGKPTMFVGGVNTSPIHKSEAYSRQFAEACVPVKAKVYRFTITDNAKLQPGTPLYATHFKPGQYVDVTGRTIFRGFAGVMKRWGFHGLPASHGTKKSKRTGGAIGTQGEARVLPGKKMAGNMGGRIRTTKGLQILRINTKYNILYLSGPIIGQKNCILGVKDSVLPKNWEVFQEDPPHFPTHIPDLDRPLPQDLYHSQLFQFTQPSIHYTIEEDN